MSEEEVRSSNKTIMLNGNEEQVLVRWYWDRVRNRINIIHVRNGRDYVYNDCSIQTRADLQRELRNDYLEGRCRRVAELAGNASLMAGGMR